MKLFGKGGKLNIIDISLIVVLLAVIVFAFVAPSLSMSDDESSDAPPAAIDETQELVFEVVCKEIDETLANSIMDSLSSGDTLFDDEEISMTRLYNNHKFIDAEVLDWEYVDGDLFMTVKGAATYANGAFTVGTQEVRIGRSYFVKTLGIEIEGVIYTMEKNG